MLRLVCAGLVMLVALDVSSAPRRYASGTILPSHRTQAQLDEDLRAYYAVWKANFLKEAGPNLYRVSFGSTNPGRTVSEGQGYGMMIAVLIAGHDPDARRIFDGLWRFARKYPSSKDARLMSWQVPPGNSDSAFDGDADIAYALLLAHSQWGSDGDIDYRAAAKRVIAGILESTIGPDTRLPMLGDWVNPNGEKYNQFATRPSDFMPEHFRAFLRATGNPAWTRVLAETQTLVTSLQSLHNTGLIPDFVVRGAPAPPNFLEAETDGDYSYNAGRVPWRLGIDALLNGNEVSRTQARRISEWARVATNGDPLRLRGGYRLNGTMIPGRDYFTIFYAAPIGVAAMNEPAQQEWLNDVYDAVRARHEDYYEDSVTLLCMFAMTGNAWTPGQGRRRAVLH